jgi:hypothetical protein
MNQDLQTFYDLTKRTRAKVLDWLATLPPEVFTREHETFAYGSLSNIYTHHSRVSPQGSGTGSSTRIRASASRKSRYRFG